MHSHDIENALLVADNDPGIGVKGGPTAQHTYVPDPETEAKVESILDTQTPVADVATPIAGPCPRCGLFMASKNAHLYWPELCVIAQREQLAARDAELARVTAERDEMSAHKDMLIDGYRDAENKLNAQLAQARSELQQIQAFLSDGAGRPFHDGTLYEQVVESRAEVERERRAVESELETVKRDRDKKAQQLKEYDQLKEHREKQEYDAYHDNKEQQ